MPFAAASKSAPCSPVSWRTTTAAGDFTAAARARLEAGIEAARRSAHTEAVEHLRQGLALLEEVADPDARRQLELALQASLIGPLASLHRTSSAELAACCRRGLQLCMEGEPAAQVFPFLYGLFTIAMARQRLRELLSLAELFVSVAERNKTTPVASSATGCSA